MNRSQTVKGRRAALPTRTPTKTMFGLAVAATLVAPALIAPALAEQGPIPVPPPRPFDLPSPAVRIETPALAVSTKPAEPQGRPANVASREPVAPSVQAGPEAMRPLIARHAQANNVPETLVHRVIQRESRYNPRAVGSGGALGLMQIKLSTARRMGYKGDAQGLLDADTNMRYAVPYLAGAYRVADGNHDQAVRNYAAGYYYKAKARRMLSVYKPVPERDAP